MPLARHDVAQKNTVEHLVVSTHMPLARHDVVGIRFYDTLYEFLLTCLLRGMTPAVAIRDTHIEVSTHMPLARHDRLGIW